MLVKPDDSTSLAHGIQEALDYPDLANSLTQNSILRVRDNTWKKRAARIIEFINEW